MSAQRSHETNVRLIAQFMKTFLGQSEMKYLFCTPVTRIRLSCVSTEKSGEGPIPTTLEKTTIALMQNHLHHNQEAIDAKIKAS